MSNILHFKKKPERRTEMTKAETLVYSVLSSNLGDATALAEVYHISAQTVRNIKLLKTKRAERVAQMMLDNGETPYTWTPARRFSDEEVDAIRASTETSEKLAKRFECSPSTIRMIKTRKTYV